MLEYFSRHGYFLIDQNNHLHILAWIHPDQLLLQEATIDELIQALKKVHLLEQVFHMHHLVDIFSSKDGM